ncbi:MAG: hypothetical protein A3F54_01400 [Candidatus Kerfeldbacteria bacterium RIFCSPHIGHO2_12_FULL_48_17]|uniref:DUF4012 domain-containing protein n=1 Tax=Candidatus Kerfeldbacteria bacterium RIFCSPHIGHO2_12_FULL_48_17 TaxID=1798542 RepID=A0A1G2AZ11_9BACT|nr:MAG: hypothetical protein A3F54_01400 [Candidatus Kerfeldbacteria bacterium RIFCSPHIGHO2_12_FULL_48_17]
MTNFLHHVADSDISGSKHPSGSKKSRKQQSEHRIIMKKKKKLSFMKKAGLFLIVFIVLSFVLVLANYQNALAAYQAALRGQDEIVRAQGLIEQQNLNDAVAALASAQAEFDAALVSVDKMKVLKLIPLVSRQVNATENILVAGSQLSSSLLKFVKFGDEILAVVQEDSDVSLDAISPEQKRQILKKMHESPPELQGAKADLDLAVLAMEKIPEYGLLSSIKKASDTVKEKLPLIQSVIDQAVPAMEALPAIVGYPNEKTYLFLLQNNTELRPTGGFIGTYGTLKLYNGDIALFETDNIYNIDEKSKGKNFKAPPWQISKYIGGTEWFLRDSNWSPDFHEAAQLATELYHLEDGPEERLDGVISVTPTFIQSLLELTGPITVSGVEFTSENLIDVLQYEVEVDFYKRGLSEAERKAIIGELANSIMDHVMALPKERWKDLWLTFQNDVNQKHILISLEDDHVQSLVEAQGWSGELKQTNGDFLMVVDANLASLKTDQVMERTVNYTLSDDKEQGLVSNVEIHYKHNGKFDWKTTRYRTYTRVYVPQGSQLLDSGGVMENDKLHGAKPGEVEVIDELGKTSFGAFISIEPGQEGVLSFRYTLPERVQEQIEGDGYTLLVQKQSGTLEHGLNVVFDLGKRILEWKPLDISQDDGDNKIRFSTDLSVDREFFIKLR